MSCIKILIADDHALFREGLKLLLNNQGDMQVIGEAVDGVDALQKAKKLLPDVVLLDISMPSMSGREAAQLIKNAVPQTQIVILSMYEKEEYIHQAFSAGALGYVIKGASSADVLTAIRTVHFGDYFVSSKVQSEIIRAYLGNREPKTTNNIKETLSEREQQIFALLVEGNSPSQISDYLFISPKTVDSHRANIMKKLGANNIVDLVKHAIRCRVIAPDFWDE